MRDVGCLKCNQNLGWSNEFIAEPKKVKVACRVNQTVIRFFSNRKKEKFRFSATKSVFEMKKIKRFRLVGSNCPNSFFYLASLSSLLLIWIQVGVGLSPICVGSISFLEDDSEDDSDVDLAEDLPLDEMPNGENLGRYNPANFLRQVTHNLSGAARNAAMRGIRDAAVMRGQGRRLTDREAQDIIDTAEEEMMNRIANRREENRIYQNQINNFRRQLSIREGSH